MQEAYHDSYAIELDGERRICRLSLAAFRVAKKLHNVDIDLSMF